MFTEENVIPYQCDITYFCIFFIYIALLIV